MVPQIDQFCENQRKMKIKVHLILQTPNGRRGGAGVGNPVPHGTGRCELDSHADTCIAGHGFAVYEETGDTCMVYPFSEKYKPIRVKIVNAITTYTNRKGVNYILLFNNVLYLPDMEVSLLCPNQLRDHGLIVEDCPRQFDSSSGHCISTRMGTWSFHWKWMA